jgi:thiamine pyrophosphokinase
LGQLLEWSPLVVVLDSAMVRVMELDIKVDTLGDFDRGFDPEIYKTSQYPIELFTHRIKINYLELLII